jgi:hypothetical protein
VPMSVWIAIGVGSFIVLALLALALASILGAIARETWELYRADVWLTLPPIPATQNPTRAWRTLVTSSLGHSPGVFRRVVDRSA